MSKNTATPIPDELKETVKKLQHLDPIALAEDATGESYKENENVGFLGLALQMEKSALMNQIMDITDDTKFSEETSEYLRKVQDFGFEIVFKEDFVSDNIDEQLYMLWHKDYSILLVFDTYHGHRNGGHIYYNWSPNPDASKNITSSGGYRSFYMDLSTMTEKPNPKKEPRWKNGQKWEKFLAIQKKWSIKDKEYKAKHNLRNVWSGDHDCREAIKFNISLLNDNGIFLKKWIDVPFMWLCHHGDKNSPLGHSDEVMEERFNKLPEYVKECIGTFKR
jgi:hypothetical protein